MNNNSTQELIENANMLLQNGGYQEAMPLLLKAKEEALFQNDYLSLCYSYLLLGQLNRNIGNISIAMEHYNNAIEIEKRLDNKSLLGKIHNDIAVLLRMTGNYQEAIKECLKSEIIFKEVGDVSSLANLYNSMANIYHQGINDIDKAIGYRTDAMKLIEATNDDKQKCTIYMNIANDYIAINDYDNALYYYNKCSEKLSKDDHHSLSLLLYNTGNVNFKQGKYEEAISCLTKSLEQFKIINAKPNIADIYNSLGLIYKEMNNSQKAINFLNESITIKKETQDTHGEADSCLNLGLLYENLKEYYKASIHYTSAKELYRIVNDIEGIEDANYKINEMHKLIIDNKDYDYYEEPCQLCISRNSDRCGWCNGTHKVRFREDEGYPWHNRPHEKRIYTKRGYPNKTF